jgi:hypothetical protein
MTLYVKSSISSIFFTFWNILEQIKNITCHTDRFISVSCLPERHGHFRKSTFAQGCQMVCFLTKNPNLGKFWRALDWKIYFMPIRKSLQTFGILHNHLLHFVFIWYIFSSFGIMFQEKSGNPAGLPNGTFHTEKSLFAIFWRSLEWKMLVCHVRPFDIHTLWPVCGQLEQIS